MSLRLRCEPTLVNPSTSVAARLVRSGSDWPTSPSTAATASELMVKRFAVTYVLNVRSSPGLPAAATSVEVLSDETTTPSSEVTSLPTRLGMVKATIGVKSAVLPASTACREMRTPTIPEAPEISEALTLGPSRVNVADTFHGIATVPLGMRCDACDAEVPLWVRKRRPGLSMDSYALITSLCVASTAYCLFCRTNVATLAASTAATGIAATSATAVAAERWRRTSSG